MTPENEIGSYDGERAARTPARPIRRSRQARRAVSTPIRRLRLVLVAFLAVGATTCTGNAAAHSTPTVLVRPSQNLARLLSSHEAFSRPSGDSPLLELVQAQRPLTGEQTVLPVIGETTGVNGMHWLHVRLPGRPNGGTGWITQAATVASTTSWHIVVDTSTRRVTVYLNGRPVRTLKAIVGKPSTPTPHGQFFVEESVQLRATDVGAPFALALSARSDVLQEFDGGPGQIALHGLENIGGVLGTAVSHGCVRLANNTMRWLAARIGPGVPVTITN